MNGAIVCRPDAGTKAGLGHLRRCLSMALALRGEGFDVTFDINEGLELVRAAGFRVGAAGRPSAFVVDSYHATTSDFQSLGRDGAKVVAIDDLGDRALPVDLVINGGVNAKTLRYPEAGRVLLGAEYALLRPEFAEDPCRIHAVQPKHLLITIGGSDAYDLTPQLISAVANRGFELIDVIIGPFFENMNRIEPLAAQQPAVRLHRDPSDPRALMLRADVALTGGGQTTFELAATATPAVAIEIAPNQRPNLAGFSSEGVLEVAGSVTDPQVVKKAIELLASLAVNLKRRVELGTNGRRLVDGRGAERAARCVAEQIGSDT